MKKEMTAFLKTGGDFVDYIEGDIKEDKSNRACVVIMVDTSIPNDECSANTLHAVIGNESLVRGLIESLFNNENTKKMIMRLATEEAKKQVIDRIIKDLKV